jgi:ribosomal protein S18 acetylase RimI-like enzyme
VRPARPDEYGALGQVTYAAYANDYSVSDDYAYELLHPEERLSEYEIWLAENPVTAELLGTVSTLRPGIDLDGRVRAGELYFRLLGVSPTARRRGIGARLTVFTLDLARRRGLHTVVLNSRADMRGAHALYRSLGFHHDEVRDFPFDDGGHEYTVFTFTHPVSSLPASEG